MIYADPGIESAEVLNKPAGFGAPATPGAVRRNKAGVEKSLDTARKVRALPRFKPLKGGGFGPAMETKLRLTGVTDNRSDLTGSANRA
jgi:hypothetical protein